MRALFLLTSLLLLPISVAFAPSSRSNDSQLCSALVANHTPLNLIRAANGKADEGTAKIPFVVDRLIEKPPSRVYSEIAEMSVEVFFNDDGNAGPWKRVILGYLRAIFRSDLRWRRERGENTNDMFVARRIVRADSPEAIPNSPPIVDFSRAFNVENDGTEYARGEVLGFCEVTERPYGISENVVEGETLSPTSLNPGVSQARPLLTNLSVAKKARSCGIGGKLVEACEQIIESWRSNPTEIILEVDGDNPEALNFYAKRGYAVLFTDHARRRFVADGVLLTRERCTKICMRKNLNAQNKKSPPRIVPELAGFLRTIAEGVLN